MGHEVIGAIRELAELGLLEEVRRDKNGELEVVWRCPSCGELVHGFEHLGLTFAETLAWARALLRSVT